MQGKASLAKKLHTDLQGKHLLEMQTEVIMFLLNKYTLLYTDNYS